MARKKTKRTLKPAAVAATLKAATVQKPAPGTWVLATAGTPPQIFVSTSDWDTGDRAFAKLHAVGEAPNPPEDPDDDLEGFTELDAASTNREKLVPVPNTVPCALTRPTANNIAVTITYMENAVGPPALLLTRVQFKYICRIYSETVPAHACPWFAFRQDDDGPSGEDIPTHRPIRVRIPVNAATVSISATGWWRHQPIGATGDAGGSGPDGLGGPQPLAQPRYETESANLTSHPPIQLPDAPMPPVNMLVGVPDLKDPASGPTKILKLGVGPTSFASPTASKAIFLGMWDGTQWNKGADPFSISNSGDLNVTFTWDP